MAISTILKRDLKPREFDVLCAAADHETVTVPQLAEHILAVLVAERACPLPSACTRVARAAGAAKKLVRRGFLREVSEGVWEITVAGRDYLERVE